MTAGRAQLQFPFHVRDSTDRAWECGRKPGGKDSLMLSSSKNNCSKWLPIFFYNAHKKTACLIRCGFCLLALRAQADAAPSREGLLRKLHDLEYFPNSIMPKPNIIKLCCINFDFIDYIH
jgi:hypothetical protein